MSDLTKLERELQEVQQKKKNYVWILLFLLLIVLIAGVYIIRLQKEIINLNTRVKTLQLKIDTLTLKLDTEILKAQECEKALKEKTEVKEVTNDREGKP